MSPVDQTQCRLINNISTNGQCGGSNEDGKYQQNTTSKPITQAGDERYGNEGEADR